MGILSWLGPAAGARRGKRRDTTLTTGRRSELRVEGLEERIALAADGLPDVSGAASVGEGQSYVLQLDPGDRVVDHWTINWGDGTPAETVDGSATSASHVYADGPAAHTITATATAEAAGPALFQWAVDAGGNGHYYGLTTGGLVNWEAAEAEAVSLGGHLVSITSQAEQGFVTGTFLSGANDRAVYWIGLTDAAVEGVFRWTTDEPFAFTNWQAGEPNDFRNPFNPDGEDYGAINWHFGNLVPGGALGSWNDVPLNGFIATATANQPLLGVMEFETLPLGPDTVRTLQVAVANLAPAAAVTGDAAGVRGRQLSFVLSASDVAADDAAGYTFSIDWEGDGVTDEVVSGPSGTPVTHAFADSGNYVVTVTATDKDGGISAAATHAVTVTAAAVQADPNDPAGTVLVVGGTAGNDWIVVSRRGEEDLLSVMVNGRDEGTFRADRLEVYGHAGNDLIWVWGFRGEALLDGGDGHDLLIAGCGNTILLGGGGNDYLLGGAGHDVLAGGDGNDFLFGGGGRNVLIGGQGGDVLFGDRDDLIVSGSVTFEDDTGALAAIRAEWASCRPRADRLANLRGRAGGLNEGHFLNDETLLDDGAVDLVFTRGGRDALFVGERDWVIDVRRRC